MLIQQSKSETAQLFELLSSVCDPEIPVLTLQDLGVLRDISIDDGNITVTITPTYTGCPAMTAMQDDIHSVLAAAGHRHVTVKQSLSPAWTTDWMSDAGRAKLRAYGIAPPERHIQCPQCGNQDVKLISEFGSTACKSLYQCQHCLEPFDYFKCI